MLLTTILQAGLSLGVFGKAVGAALAAFAAAFGIGKIGKAAIEAGMPVEEAMERWKDAQDLEDAAKA